MKRLFDIVLSLILLICTSPIMLVVMLMIWLSYGRPILFVQARPGYKEKIFKLCKFRTMRIEAGLSDAERLTGLGRFLRKASLDELPQLWNVFKGEMSFVGPRPLLVEYLPLYNDEQHRRHDAKPGITGWAQVNGRNAISWEQKFKLDVWYVDHQSFWLDIKIMWLTFLKVVRGSGTSAEGHVTMPKFKGDRDE